MALSLGKKLKMIHRCWRYRFKSEVHSIQYVLSGAFAGLAGAVQVALQQVVGQRHRGAQVAQKITHLGLMAAHQFTERIGILLRHHLGHQFIVANPWCPCLFAYSEDSAAIRPGSGQSL